MERRSFVKMLGAAGVAAVAAPAVIRKASAQDKPTIALIPGLTADGFYVTMHHGAEAAAKAVGAELIYQGAAEWNVSLQVPILEAVIAKKPNAIMIAPTDKQQLIAPLKKAHDAGIAVICVDTFIGNGVFQTGSGDADFPISYIASDNLLGGRMAARALAKAIGEKGKVYVSNVKPGVSTTDQREEGFKEEMKNYKDIEVLETQFNDDDANKAAAQFQAVLGRAPDLAGVFGANLFSAGGTANGAKQAGVTGKVKLAGFDAPESIVPQLKDGTFELTIAQHPAEIGYFGFIAAYAHVTDNPVPTAIGTGFTVMTGANIDDPNVSRFLYKSS
ncbi:ABC transporter substrate-binding protein [Mesorhizobium sp. BAC0120]|uniref:ABC transporter substrate-binding protein n=1 Tax=Mesorhizobium sp. BAC0120 TaxID=3090670 RepID=UPI00298D590E|nr:ABC transporter substrate-binding protein [Mesorhizobium sp. BAC0120]MDW6024367.1 ABC transporter substrate-binding protein [Mesorhizobium sp. BAC0120]